MSMIKSLWPTRILIDNISNTNTIQNCFNFLVSSFKEHNFPTNYTNINLSNEKELEEVVDYINEKVKEYLSEVWEYKDEFSIKIHASDHKNIIYHNHACSILSGVFYVSATDGDLLMYDPRNNANRGYNSDVISQKEFSVEVLEVKVGDIVIFPSYLWHETMQSYSDFPRIIMPFDVFIVEK